MVTKIIWNKAALRTFDEITTYLLDNYSLFISDFWDTRQDPNKRPY